MGRAAAQLGAAFVTAALNAWCRTAAIDAAQLDAVAPFGSYISHFKGVIGKLMFRWATFVIMQR
jgi:hypothetical protein